MNFNLLFSILLSLLINGVFFLQPAFHLSDQNKNADVNYSKSISVRMQGTNQTGTQAKQAQRTSIPSHNKKHTPRPTSGQLFGPAINSQAKESHDKAVALNGSSFLDIRYPSLSRQKEEEGEVFLKLTFKSQGPVEDVQLLRSSGHKRLDEEALRAARFFPYDGSREKEVRISFRLQD